MWTFVVIMLVCALDPAPTLTVGCYIRYHASDGYISRQATSSKPQTEQSTTVFV